MSKSDRQEEARLEILEGAAKVMARQGFHGTSMRDLARELDRSLAGFYNYFSSKEEILLAIQTRAFESLIRSAKEAIDGVDESSGKLYGFVLQHVMYVATNHEVMKILVQEGGTLPADPRSRIRALKEEYFKIARAVMKELMTVGCGSGDANSPRHVAGVELDRITYTLFGMLNWTYGWYVPTAHGTPQQLARTIHHVVLCGVIANCPKTPALRAVDRNLQAEGVTPLLSLSPADLSPA